MATKLTDTTMRYVGDKIFYIAFIHMCCPIGVIEDFVQQWFRKWLDACSAPNHYLT